MAHWRYSLIGYLVGIIYRMLSATWRYKVHWLENLSVIDFNTKKPETSLIFAHWHGDELALIGFCKHSKFLTFSSKSKDGSIMAAALKVLGFSLIRGSSSRGGASALVSLIKKLRNEHYYVSFAIDGPKGPRHQAKPGIYYVAYKIQLPMVQCLVECDNKWDIPNTWNKTYVPKPFAKINLYFLPVPQATEHNRETIIQLLNSRNSRIKKQEARPEKAAA